MKMARTMFSELGMPGFYSESPRREAVKLMIWAVRSVFVRRANHEKLHVVADQVALTGFSVRMKAAARKLYFPQQEGIKDVTHRYDALRCEPEELWIVGAAG